MTLYIPAFKSQHEGIENSVNTCDQLWSRGESEECLNELKHLQALLSHHHEVERSLLFEQLKDLPKMNQGGPFCSYFFEFFMNNRPLMMSEMFISRIRGANTKLTLPTRVESFFVSKSLLSIPIEEHLACEFICDELISVLSRKQPNSSQWVKDVLLFLKDLISTNHKKEETCLWVAAESAMDPQNYQQLANTTVLPTAG